MKIRNYSFLRFLILLVAFSSAVTLLIVASGAQYSKRLFPEPVVNIDYTVENQFLDEQGIKNMVYDFVTKLDTTNTVDQLNLLEIEQLIEENPYVKKAEAFTDINGRLRLEVVQKEPVIRVINKAGVSYYLSKSADRIPLSVKFTSRVPVVTGNIGQVSDSEADSMQVVRLLELVKTLRNDPVLWAMIEQIELDEEEGFILVSKLGYHKINIGTVERLPNKLKKLKLWYRQSVRIEDWRKYESIDLRYQGQIVCKKH